MAKGFPLHVPKACNLVPQRDLCHGCWVSCHPASTSPAPFCLFNGFFEAYHPSSLRTSSQEAFWGGVCVCAFSLEFNVYRNFFSLIFWAGVYFFHINVLKWTFSFQKVRIPPFWVDSRPICQLLGKEVGKQDHLHLTLSCFTQTFCCFKTNEYVHTYAMCQREFLHFPRVLSAGTPLQVSWLMLAHELFWWRVNTGTALPTQQHPQPALFAEVCANLRPVVWQQIISYFFLFENFYLKIFSCPTQTTAQASGRSGQCWGGWLFVPTSGNTCWQPLTLAVQAAYTHISTHTTLQLRNKRSFCILFYVLCGSLSVADCCRSPKLRCLVGPDVRGWLPD